MKHNEGLTNKKVVVLGGSVGIGFATAQAAAEAGAHVVIVSSNKQRVDSAVQQIGTQAEGYVADLGDEQQTKQLFDQLGSFDHLVYTAGENIKIGMLADTALDDARKFYNLRYWGAVTAVKYGAPHINTGGSITLTSGTAGRKPGKGWFLGASMCAAMEGFTRAMAIELAPLRVNLVCPGLVRTNLWDSFPEDARENIYHTYSNMLPVQRIGEPEDIAQAYLYLMQQGYSTGEVVVVDGGGVLV